ncbi:class I SAM-dependent methyltransferase [Persephonella sp.]|uniref:class I SAM-dependent methyltransferase n=1 Tax=Persephonella sp. TaxID=2060922 RepID=UPI0025D15BF7|nr:class I SAM-dependent methyltransferase [Persephonella sp.]
MAQEKIAARIFDSVVKRYDRFLKFATFGFIDRWQEILVKQTPAGNFPLDVGTGTGEVVKKIHSIYPNSIPVGIDVAFNMLKKAKEKNKEKKNLFIRASAYDLPFKNKSIDSILTSLVFRHLEPDNAAREFSRILKDGGHIGILDISKPSKFIYGSIYFFANKIFRPIGEKIFSKDEYDYFMESIENSMTPKQLEEFFKEKGYSKVFMEKRFLGMVVIAVFKKEADIKF